METEPSDSAVVRTFEMLISRTGALEDQVQALRQEMREHAIPRLKDVKPAIVAEMKKRITEREIVSGIVGHRTSEHAVFNFRVPQDLVQQLKENGFRVSEAVHGYNNDVVTSVVTWGDDKIDETALRSWWARKEEFTEL